MKTLNEMLHTGGGMVEGAVARNTYRFECYDKDGNLKWVEEVPNLVVDEGLDETLDKFFKGSNYTASFFVGLVDNAGFTAFAAGDTAAQIDLGNGWGESVAYSEATREALTLGAVSSQSVDNSASKASFSINATAVIKGAFVVTNSTKGGTGGLLYGEAAFAANRSVENGDTLNVQVTLTQASA